jgi:hypothetical protein
MQAVHTSEMSVNFCQITRSYIFAETTLYSTHMGISYPTKLSIVPNETWNPEEVRTNTAYDTNVLFLPRVAAAGQICLLWKLSHIDIEFIFVYSNTITDL